MILTIKTKVKMKKGFKDVFSTARCLLCEELESKFDLASCLLASGSNLGFGLISCYADLLTAYNEMSDLSFFVKFKMFDNA